MICIQNKFDNQPNAELLQPIPVPHQVWSEVSMDFIEGLPRLEGKDSIMVVVDRSTKYAYSIPLTPIRLQWWPKHSSTRCTDYMDCRKRSFLMRIESLQAKYGKDYSRYLGPSYT